MRLLSDLLDATTTRRLTISLLSAAGALLFAAFNLIGAGVSGNDTAYAARVSACVTPLFACLLFGFIALVCTEIAEHPSTLEEGHPHSRRNYLQTAGTLVIVLGVIHLVWGAVALMVSAKVDAP